MQQSANTRLWTKRANQRNSAIESLACAVPCILTGTEGVAGVLDYLVDTTYPAGLFCVAQVGRIPNGSDGHCTAYDAYVIARGRRHRPAWYDFVKLLSTSSTMRRELQPWTRITGTCHWAPRDNRNLKRRLKNYETGHGCIRVRIGTDISTDKFDFRLVEHIAFAHAPKTTFAELFVELQCLAAALGFAKVCDFRLRNHERTVSVICNPLSKISEAGEKELVCAFRKLHAKDLI